MAQESVAEGAPAPGSGPLALPVWPFAASFAAGFALIGGYHWATPRDEQQLAWFPVNLVISATLAGFTLLGFARAGALRLAWPSLPLGVLGVAPAAVGWAAGGWPGGWPLGLAGVATPARSGGGSGTLAPRAGGCSRGGHGRGRGRLAIRPQGATVHARLRGAGPMSPDRAGERPNQALQQTAGHDSVPGPVTADCHWGSPQTPNQALQQTAAASSFRGVRSAPGGGRC